MKNDYEGAVSPDNVKIKIDGKNKKGGSGQSAKKMLNHADLGDKKGGSSSQNPKSNDDDDDNKPGSGLQKQRTLNRGNSNEDITNIMKKIRNNDQERNKREQMKKKSNNQKSAFMPAVQNLDSVFDKKNDGKKKDLIASKLEEVKEGDKKGKGYKLHRRTSSTEKKGSKGGKKGQKGDSLEHAEDVSDDEKGVKQKKASKAGSDEGSNEESESNDDRMHSSHHSSELRKRDTGMKGIASATSRTDIINEKVE